MASVTRLILQPAVAAFPFPLLGKWWALLFDMEITVESSTRMRPKGREVAVGIEARAPEERISRKTRTRKPVDAGERR